MKQTSYRKTPDRNLPPAKLGFAGEMSKLKLAGEMQQKSCFSQNVDA